MQQSAEVHTHVIHNAANFLQRSMPNYEYRIMQLKAICELCRTNRHKPRLMATCLGDAAGQSSADAGDDSAENIPELDQELMNFLGWAVQPIYGARFSNFPAL